MGLFLLGLEQRRALGFLLVAQKAFLQSIISVIWQKRELAYILWQSTFQLMVNLNCSALRVLVLPWILDKPKCFGFWKLEKRRLYHD